MTKEYERCFRVSTLLDDFQEYLKTVVGVTKGTIDTQLYHVIKYLKFKSNNEFITITAISSLSISNYLIDLNNHVKPKTTQNIASSLKSFLRFLFINGFIKSDETMMIPKFPCWKLSEVPQQFSDDDVEKIINSFNGNSPLDIRNKAIILCLSKLGLRPLEVVTICLDDIDWKLGTINILKNKCRRADTLPLLQEVGEALTNYLKNGRPISKERYIFVNHGNKKGAPISRGTIGDIVRGCFKKAGLKVPYRASYIFRHTLAGKMLLKGASIKEIADALRHRSLDTTMIYTKINFPELNDVTMSWPEVIA